MSLGIRQSKRLICWRLLLQQPNPGCLYSMDPGSRSPLAHSPGDTGKAGCRGGRVWGAGFVKEDPPMRSVRIYQAANTIFLPPTSYFLLPTSYFLPPTSHIQVTCLRPRARRVHVSGLMLQHVPAAKSVLRRTQPGLGRPPPARPDPQRRPAAPIAPRADILGPYFFFGGQVGASMICWGTLLL